MSSFILRLYDTKQTQEFPSVTSFSGSDESGSFGIHAYHERMMSVLIRGLASFTLADGNTFYMACPGAVLYFNDNTLSISTRHYIVDSDHRQVRQLLENEIEQEEEQLHGLKQSLHRMEEAMLKRIWEMERIQ